MRLSKKTNVVLGIALVVFVFLICLYNIFPVANTVYTRVIVYKTSVAYRDNYKLHTTPLPKNVVDDLCLKLFIKDSSESCNPDAIVYAPDLFDEVKAYFNGLSDESKTYEAVQSILGTFLIHCGTPDLKGRYRCQYDLRGDKIYPIAFYFDKHNFYYQIMANTGGS